MKSNSVPVVPPVSICFLAAMVSHKQLLRGKTEGGVTGPAELVELRPPPQPVFLGERPEDALFIPPKPRSKFDPGPETLRFVGHRLYAWPKARHAVTATREHA